MPASPSLCRASRKFSIAMLQCVASTWRTAERRRKSHVRNPQKRERLDGNEEHGNPLPKQKLPPDNPFNRSIRLRRSRLLHLPRPLVQRPRPRLGFLPLGNRRHHRRKPPGSLPRQRKISHALPRPLGLRRPLHAPRRLVALGHHNRHRLPQVATDIRLGRRRLRERVCVVFGHGHVVSGELYVSVLCDWQFGEE